MLCQLGVEEIVLLIELLEGIGFQTGLGNTVGNGLLTSVEELAEHLLVELSLALQHVEVEDDLRRVSSVEGFEVSRPSIVGAGVVEHTSLGFDGKSLTAEVDAAVADAVAEGA